MNYLRYEKMIENLYWEKSSILNGYWVNGAILEAKKKKLILAMQQKRFFPFFGDTLKDGELEVVLRIEINENNSEKMEKYLSSESGESLFYEFSLVGQIIKSDEEIGCLDKYEKVGNTAYIETISVTQKNKGYGFRTLKLLAKKASENACNEFVIKKVMNAFDGKSYENNPEIFERVSSRLKNEEVIKEYYFAPHDSVHNNLHLVLK